MLRRLSNVFGSDLLDNEKKTWVNHQLQYDPKLREIQLAQVCNFGKHLKICHRPETFLGLTYWHFFVTDDTWVIEFGGGNLASASVIIHPHPIQNFIVEAKFDNSPEILRRMQNVCGARSYSLCLRNCEHLARYIFSGSWISLQTVGAGNIAKRFLDYMAGEQKALFNQLPAELCETRTYGPVILNLPGNPKLKFVASTNTVPKDPEAFNVLFLGPTGAGKSRLINLLMDYDVCPSSDSGESVTSQVQVLHTEGYIGVNRRTINVIDTVGLCDTKRSTADVLAITKQFCKHQQLDIHSVVIVVKPRLEDAHVEGIKQFLTWLKYKKTHQRFTFVFNRLDDATPALKAQNLSQLVQKLGLETDFVQHNDLGEVIQKKLALGFPSQNGKCDHDRIGRDLDLLATAVLDNPTDQPPLDVQESWCILL